MANKLIQLKDGDDNVFPKEYSATHTFSSSYGDFCVWVSGDVVEIYIPSLTNLPAGQFDIGTIPYHTRSTIAQDYVALAQTTFFIRFTVVATGPTTSKLIGYNYGSAFSGSANGQINFIFIKDN